MKNIFSNFSKYILICFICLSCGVQKTDGPVNEPPDKGDTTSVVHNKVDHCLRLQNKFYSENGILRKSIIIDIERDDVGDVKEKISPLLRGSHKAFDFLVKSLKIGNDKNFFVVGFEFELSSVETKRSKILGLKPVLFTINSDDFEYNSRKSSFDFDSYNCYLSSNLLESEIYKITHQNAYDILYSMSWSIAVRVKYKNFISFETKTPCQEILFSEFSKPETGIYFSCEGT